MKNNFPLAPQVAIGAVVIQNKKVLLVKRNKEPGKGDWAIPGGSVKLGETLQQAAEREILEETGLRIRAKEPVYIFDAIIRDGAGQIRFHYVIIDLMADFISGEPAASDDAADAGWFGPEELEGFKVSERTKDLLRKIQFLC